MTTPHFPPPTDRPEAASVPGSRAGGVIAWTIILGFVAFLVAGTMMAMNSPGGSGPGRSSEDQVRIESHCWGLAEEQGVPWSERNDFVDDCSR